MRDSIQLYGVDLEATLCPQCDRAFLAASASLPRRCPHCPLVTLEPIEDTSGLPPAPTPELVVPFDVSAEKLAQRVNDFANSYYFTPTDLTPAHLQTRLTKQYLPVWLVDCAVASRWQAEVGFDYEVLSHSEAFQNGRWQTTEKRKIRVNWEPRVGELNRHYDNLRANALDEHAQFVEPLGKFKIWDAVAYDAAEHGQSALFRLPNRETVAAWPDVIPEVMQRCEKDCTKAASGQHIRQFHWDPHFSEQHWTSLLLPIFTTYYLDDEGQQIPLLIHGRSGSVIGRKVASMQLARRAAILIATVAALMFLLVALALFGVLSENVLVLTMPATLLGLAAIGPFVYVSSINSRSE